MSKILIADDEANILKLTELLFKELGMEVITCSNGEEAINVAIKEKPDIVITDVVMPKKNGFEVCRAIRNNPNISDTPIIILSALGDEFNKITGFEEGADDYITKPFNIDELKARTKVLLFRAKSKSSKLSFNPVPSQDINKTVSDVEIKQISSGITSLDESLFGGFPVGSNILVIGSVGKGKSSYGRKFISNGLLNNEKCLFISIDDDPKKVRSQLEIELPLSTREYENQDLLRFVDAYSWSTFAIPEDEPFAVNGILELNQFAGVISDASYELGQTVQKKQGGCRVIDSISSLLVNFELPAVQRFLSQIARTAVSFGDVTTLFIVEADTVPDIVLNNIKYLLDGILEFSEIEGKRCVRVCSMKWTKYSNDWNYY